MIFLLVVKNKQLFSMKHPTITFICSKIERKPISKFKTVRSAPPAPLIGKRHRVTCSKDASCRTRRVITPRHVRVTSRHLVTHGNIRRRIRIYRVRAAQPTDLDWDESTSHAMPKKLAGWKHHSDKQGHKRSSKGNEILKNPLGYTTQ